MPGLCPIRAPKDGTIKNEGGEFGEVGVSVRDELSL